MTKRQQEVIRLLKKYGPLTENAINSRFERPTKSLRVVLSRMQKDGTIKQNRSRWMLTNGPQEPTDLEIEQRKYRIDDRRKW